MKNQNKARTFSIKTFLCRAFLLTLVVMCVFSISACGDKQKVEDKTEKIVWADMILADKLPELPDSEGEVYINTIEQLYITINTFSNKQYAEYIDACKTKGYTIDAETTSISYSSYNSEGYKLYISYYETEGLSINLEAPMEMNTITWPAGTAGKVLPPPESNIGKFSFEYDDSFFVYIGNTSKEDFAEYINTCSEAGFNVDYSKGDNYYFANNSEGWNLSLNYEGNNIMSISINAPEEETAAPTTAPEAEPATEKATEKPAEKATEKKESNASGIDPDFKAAMDSYEEFMDEYVAFMKKYNANPNDMTLLTDYLDYLDEYADMVKEFNKWEDEDLNDEEFNYYLEVQTRVTQKLLEVN